MSLNSALHILLTVSSKGKQINNKALNIVLNTVSGNVEDLDKKIPRAIKDRYGRSKSNPESE